MGLSAYELIVDRMLVIIRDVWPVERVYVGVVREEAMPPYAVLQLQRVDRERVGPRVVQERYEFVVIGVFAREPGEREELALMERARVLLDELTANATFVTDVANGLEVFEVMPQLMDEMEELSGVALGVRVLSSCALEPADA